MQGQAAHPDDGFIFEQVVVAGEHCRVGSGHPDLIAGVTDSRYRLDVIPVAVCFQNGPDIKRPTELKQLLVLVGGIQKNRLACLAASKYEHIVLIGAYNQFVDLGLRVAVVKGVAHGVIVADREGGCDTSPDVAVERVGW